MSQLSPSATSKAWAHFCEKMEKSVEGIVFYISDFNWGKNVFGIVRVKASRISRTVKWYSLGGCRTAQALLNSQLNNTELSQYSEVQISLEMHLWGNSFSLKIFLLSKSMDKMQQTR